MMKKLRQMIEKYVPYSQVSVSISYYTNRKGDYLVRIFFYPGEMPMETAMETLQEILLPYKYNWEFRGYIMSYILNEPIHPKVRIRF